MLMNLTHTSTMAMVLHFTQGAIVKLDEIARLAGVSRTTASYVINGKAKQYRVSDKTVEKSWLWCVSTITTRTPWQLGFVLDAHVLLVL